MRSQNIYTAHYAQTIHNAPLLGLLSLTTPSSSLHEFIQARSSTKIIIDPLALFSDISNVFPLGLKVHQSSNETTPHFDTQPFDTDSKFMPSFLSDTRRTMTISLATCLGFIFGALATLLVRARRPARKIVETKDLGYGEVVRRPGPVHELMGSMGSRRSSRLGALESMRGGTVGGRQGKWQALGDDEV